MAPKAVWAIGLLACPAALASSAASSGFLAKNTAEVVEETPAAFDESLVEVNATDEDIQNFLSTLTAEGGSSCTEGNVGKLRKLAPRCIDQCKSSCGAINSALSAYLRGGQPMAQRSVCGNSRAFECFVSSNHIGACRTLISKAASYGFKLPDSKASLHQQCGARLSLAEEEPSVASDEPTVEINTTKDIQEFVSSLTAEGGSSCTEGNVGKLRKLAPRCIDQCKSSCGAINSALSAYLRGGQPMAQRSVCGNSRAFECFVSSNHIGACRTLISKAASYGFKLPDSKASLHQQCGARLSLAEEESSAPSDEPTVEINTTKDIQEFVSSLTAEGGSSCTEGNVGKLRKLAPDCIDQCKSSCGAINSAVSAYLRGGQPMAQRSVCSNSRAFECFVTPNHIGECRTFIEKAASYGFKLPDSQASLHQQCSPRLSLSEEESSAPSDEPAVEINTTKDIQEFVSSLTAEGGSSCTEGNVGKLRKLAPRCIDQCKSSCGAINSALSAYLRGGQPMAQRSVCGNSRAFECFVSSNHIGACRTLISKAASYGFKLPDSKASLHQQCGARLSLATQEQEQDPFWCNNVPPGARSQAGCTGNSQNAPAPGWCSNVPAADRGPAQCLSGFAIELWKDHSDELHAEAAQDPAWCISVAPGARVSAGCTGSSRNAPNPSWCHEVGTGNRAAAGCTGTAPYLEVADLMKMGLEQDPSWCMQVGPGLRNIAGCTGANSRNAPPPAWCAEVAPGRKADAGCVGGYAVQLWKEDADDEMTANVAQVPQDPAWCISVPPGARVGAGCTGSYRNAPNPSWCHEVASGKRRAAGCTGAGPYVELDNASELAVQDPNWCANLPPGARGLAGCTASNSQNAPAPGWCNEVGTGNKGVTGCSGLASEVQLDHTHLTSLFQQPQCIKDVTVFDGPGDLRNEADTVQKCKACRGSSAHLEYDASRHYTNCVTGVPSQNKAQCIKDVTVFEGEGDLTGQANIQDACKACRGSNAHLVFAPGVHGSGNPGYTSCEVTFQALVEQGPQDPAWCISVAPGYRKAAGCTGSYRNAPCPSWCHEVASGNRASTGCTCTGPYLELAESFALASQDPFWCNNVPPGARAQAGCTGSSQNAPAPGWCSNVPAADRGPAQCLSELTHPVELEDVSLDAEPQALVEQGPQDPAWCISVAPGYRKAAGCTGSYRNAPCPSWCHEVASGNRASTGCTCRGPY